MNKLIMQGVLVKDVDFKYSANGTAFSRISISITDAKKKTDYFNLVVFFDLAEQIANSYKKGDKIYFEGKLQNNNYEKDGKKVYQDRIIVDKLLQESSLVTDDVLFAGKDIDLPF